HHVRVQVPTVAAKLAGCAAFQVDSAPSVQPASARQSCQPRNATLAAAVPAAPVERGCITAWTASQAISRAICLVNQTSSLPTAENRKLSMVAASFRTWKGGATAH